MVRGGEAFRGGASELALLRPPRLRAAQKRE